MTTLLLAVAAYEAGHRRRWIVVLGTALGCLILNRENARALYPLLALWLLGDSQRYMDWASAIAAGDWVGSGAFYQAPLYPYVLAVIFSIFGASAVAGVSRRLLADPACAPAADLWHPASARRPRRRDHIV